MPSLLHVLSDRQSTLARLSSNALVDERQAHLSSTFEALTDYFKYLIENSTKTPINKPLQSNSKKILEALNTLFSPKNIHLITKPYFSHLAMLIQTLTSVGVNPETFNTFFPFVETSMELIVGFKAEGVNIFNIFVYSKQSIEPNQSVLLRSMLKTMVHKSRSIFSLWKAHVLSFLESGHNTFSNDFVFVISETMAAVALEKPTFETYYNCIVLFFEISKFISEDNIRFFSDMRGIWCKARENQIITNDIVEYVRGIHDPSPNSHIFILFLLLDYNVTDPDVWNIFLPRFEEISPLQLGQFSAFLAVKYFIKLLNIDENLLCKNARSSTTPGLEKCFGPQVTSMISTFECFYSSPWVYTTSFLGFYPESALDFDFFGPYPEYSEKLIDCVINSKTSLSILHFIRAVLRLETSLSTIIRCERPYFIFQKYLRVLFLFDSHNLLRLDVVRQLFNDVTLRFKLPMNVFSLYTKYLILSAFSTAENIRKKAFFAICDAVCLGFPGVEFLTPVFQFMLCRITNAQDLDFEQISLALSSAYCLGWNRPISPMKVIFQKDPSNSIDKDLVHAFMSNLAQDMPRLFRTVLQKAPAGQRGTVFSTLLTTLVEIALSGGIVSSYIAYASSFISILEDHEMDAIQYLIPYASILGIHFPPLVEILLGPPVTHKKLSLAVDFFISCYHYCKFDCVIDSLVRAVESSNDSSIKLRFIAEAGRYPYKGGPPFQESHVPLPSELKFAMINATRTISIMEEKEESMIFHNLTNTGRCSFEVKITPSWRPRSQNSKTFQAFKRSNLSEQELITSTPNAEGLLLKDMEYKSTSLETIDTQEEEFLESRYSKAAYLVALGMVEPNKKSHDSYSMLDIENPMVQRLVKAVGRESYRTSHKIAVLYVGKGQRKESDILGNTMSDVSSAFVSFISNLGHVIDLEKHTASTGGLDVRNFSNGKQSIYYADALREVAFHVAPMMPNKEGDSAFVMKKKHVGNDSVKIIWCEDTEEYKPTTIMSQFNHVNILVVPIGGTCYSVTTLVHPSLEWFGILRNKSIVNKDTLAQLVRFTAIHGDLASRKLISDGETPAPMANDIRERLLGMAADKRVRPLTSALKL